MADLAPSADSPPLDVADAIAQLGSALSVIHRQVTSPTGRVLTTGPPGLRPDVREDLVRAIGLAS